MIKNVPKVQKRNSGQLFLVEWSGSQRTKIIDRGEIVDQGTYNILESLRKESIKRSESLGQKRLILGGQILFVSIFILCFMLYLELFRKDYYQRKGSLSLLFILIVFYNVITALMVTHNISNVYILPYAMLPIIIRVFLDSRTAFLTHVITILICSITLRFPHEFILVQLAAGLVAIFSLRNYHKDHSFSVLRFWSY